MLLWSCSRMTQLHTCNQCLFTVPSTLFCLTQSRNFFSCILLLDIELHNPPKLIQCDNLVHSSETAQWGPCQCAQTGPLLKVVHRHRTDFLGTLVPGPERHTNLKYISKQDEFFLKYRNTGRQICWRETEVLYMGKNHGVQSGLITNKTSKTSKQIHDHFKVHLCCLVEVLVPSRGQEMYHLYRFDFKLHIWFVYVHEERGKTALSWHKNLVTLLIIM